MASKQVFLNLTSLLFSTSIFLLIPVLPVYLYRDLGASEQEVGLILPLAFITSALIRIPSSLRIRRSIVRALMLGLAVNTAAIAGYGISWNAMSFALFRILHGFGLALNYTLLLTIAGLIAESGGTERSITSYTTALSIGFWLGPLVGLILRSVIALRHVILATSILGVAAIAAASPLLRYRGSRADERFMGGWSGLKDVLKPPNLLLALIYFLFSFAVGGVFAYGPLKGKIELGLSDQLVIFFFLIYYFAAFVSRVFLLRFSGGGRSLKLIAFSLVAAALGVLILGLGRDLASFGLGLCLAGLAHGLVFPLTASAVAVATPIELRVLGNSLHLTAFDLGSLSGSSTVSLLLGFMSISGSLASISVLPAAGLLALWRLSRLEQMSS